MALDAGVLFSSSCDPAPDRHSTAALQSCVSQFTCVYRELQENDHQSQNTDKARH